MFGGDPNTPALLLMYSNASSGIVASSYLPWTLLCGDGWHAFVQLGLVCPRSGYGCDLGTADIDIYIKADILHHERSARRDLALMAAKGLYHDLRFIYSVHEAGRVRKLPLQAIL